MNSQDKRLLRRQQQRSTTPMTEIARSFSFKVSCQIYGGPNYESQDFFCSQKATCTFADAPKISDALYKFCKAEVMKAVRAWLVERGWRTDPLEPQQLPPVHEKHPEAKTNARAYEEYQRKNREAPAGRSKLDGV